MHLLAIMLAALTDGKEMSPSGSKRLLRVVPIDMKIQLLHTGAIHNRPLSCMAILKTIVKANRNPAGWSMSKIEPFLISKGKAMRPALTVCAFHVVFL